MTTGALPPLLLKLLLLLATTLDDEVAARVSHVNPVDGADTALAVTARGAGDDERLFNALNMPLVGLGTVRLKGGPTTLLKFFSLGGRLVDTARTCSGATVRHLRCI